MNRESRYAIVIDRICREPTLRRQFLWLRAQEKGDVEIARDLERLDPTLSRRVAVLQAEFVARGHRLDTPEERRAGFARMQDELLEECTQRLA